MRNRYKWFGSFLLAVTLAFFTTESVGRPVYRQKTEAVVAWQAQQDVKRMEKELLGPYHNTASLTASNLQHAYIIFLENVNASQSNWTSSDWSTAQIILNHLNNKYTSLYVFLNVSDKAKIKALQTEFMKLQQKSMASR